MSYDIGFVLDGVILVFLGVTIFYAARLSLFFKSFREGREGIRILIRDLSVTIDRAEKSIASMKENAGSTATILQETINEAKFLSDELRFMNETGDGLAGRLEKLADRNRELVDLMENSGGIGTQKITQLDPSTKNYQAPASKKTVVTRSEDPFEISDFEIDEDDEQDFLALSDGAYRETDHPASKIDTEAKSKVRSFAIFDRDYVGETEELEKEIDSKFHSRAEQDLYEALQRKKRVSEVS